MSRSFTSSALLCLSSLSFSISTPLFSPQFLTFLIVLSHLLSSHSYLNESRRTFVKTTVRIILPKNYILLCPQITFKVVQHHLERVCWDLTLRVCFQRWMSYIDCLQLTKVCLTAQWIVIRLKLHFKSFSFVLNRVLSPRATGPKQDSAERHLQSKETKTLCTQTQTLGVMPSARMFLG